MHHVIATSVTLAEGQPHSILDEDGSALIVHENPDSYQADAGAGGRIACGVIEPAGHARDLAAGHLSDVRAKIAVLRTMERVLSDMIERCTTGVTPECPLIEALFDPTKDKEKGAS